MRITSDCPCIDPEVADFIIGRHIQNGSDYTSNSLQRSYPHGLDVEVFNFGALEKTFNEATEDFEREHVTPHIYRSGKFSTQNIEAPEGFRGPDIRITLDTQEDYALLCIVYDFLYSSSAYFGAEAIINLFDAKPWLRVINEKVLQKKIFDNLEEELREAEKVLELQDLKRARDCVRDFLEKRH